jgi:hypothetical protein
VRNAGCKRKKAGCRLGAARERLEVPNSVPATEGEGAFFQVKAAAGAHSRFVPGFNMMEGSDRTLRFEVEPSEPPNFGVRQAVEDRFKSRRTRSFEEGFQVLRTRRSVGVETESRIGWERHAHSDDGVVKLLTLAARNSLGEEIMAAVGTT